jgi:hypothetical protein
MTSLAGRVAATLELCRGCNQFVYPEPPVCAHCGADRALAEGRYRADLAAAGRAARLVESSILGRR